MGGNLSTTKVKRGNVGTLKRKAEAADRSTQCTKRKR